MTLGPLSPGLRVATFYELTDILARVDAEEDGKYGKGKRGDDLPAELARRESRVAKIREAKAALEQEAKEQAAAEKARVEAQLQEREKQEQERGRKLGGRKPQVADPEQAQPDPKAQRNFTGPDSRLMKDGATKEFVQGYNAQAVVEPVFGQIKEQRGFRRFLLRGLTRVQAEWQRICATHNLLKLFHSGWKPQNA